ncbi:Hypothetical predicted protein [Olea europaea subsp. europaea]|uniref:Uncharacterized protein n=1 Tax=Olea europaea subsp. europaea TaxID=158383 RepID=A0A8S0QAS6_OLEEU|nr:Hypothetical predicted protein [Olea europaea subsp. europaea]
MRKLEGECQSVGRRSTGGDALGRALGCDSLVVGYGQEAILNFAVAGLKCGDYDVGGLLQVMVAVDELDKQVYYMAVGEVEA